MEKQIILSEEEIAVIEKQLKGGVGFEFENDREKEVMMELVDKADELIHELDAYDELDGDLIAWYYNKYKAQQTA